jgi:hypothetical protein
MSFGESMFPTGFNQKTAKKDLFIKGNYGISSRNQCGKVLEDSRRLSTEAGLDPLTCGADRPLGVPPVSLFATPVLHRLLGCTSVVYSNRFDLRAQD